MWVCQAEIDGGVWTSLEALIPRPLAGPVKPALLPASWTGAYSGDGIMCDRASVV